MNENKNYQHPDVQDPENDELEIDWMEILRKIIAIRKTLYKAAGVGVVLGIIIALSIPKQYTVTVTLSPEMSGDKAGGGLASLASSFLGGGASSSPDATTDKRSNSTAIFRPIPIRQLHESRNKDTPFFRDSATVAAEKRQKVPLSGHKRHAGAYSTTRAWR